MKRIIITYCTLLISVSMGAITQTGNVRTIARKGQPGTPVEGVIIRLQGTHNKVASREDGTFSLLLHSMQNGDPYSIASVVKTGYIPAEQELIGKRLPCSDKVPLEILLVNRVQLAQEREEIETKARENVELFYQSRLDSLEQLLAANRITAQQMQEAKQRLESQYENFEPLLQAMSDLLARTDYSRMDSLTARMQQAVESGNPEEAERLLREKGSIAQRKAMLHEWNQQLTALQHELNKNNAEYALRKRELEDDCYRLYASFLTRFMNDSAGYYIRERAALDTTNIDYQLQAGQFMMSILADLPAAKRYSERAYRIAQSQYGELTGQMATTCNEMGLICKKQRDLDAARTWYERSLSIREKIRGKNSPAVAEALNNLGELYSANKDYQQAMKAHQRALKIREKAYGSNSLKVAESKNNIAGVYFHQGQWNKAEQLFKDVQAIFCADDNTPKKSIADCHTNLGAVAYKLGKYEEALSHFEQAYSIYEQVLGAAHPATRNAAQLKQIALKKIEKQ